MKVCPFCLEAVRDEAVKCRYCASSLSDQKRAPADLPTTDSDQVIYVVNRDLIRFVKYAAWCLLLLITVGVIFYLYGFHFTKIPAKPDQVTYTYVLDADLLRFVKFALSVLGIFVTVGVFLYGFQIKQAAKEAKESADSTRQARYDVGKAKDEVAADQKESHRLLAEAQRLLASTQGALETAQKNVGKVADEVQANMSQVATDQKESRRLLEQVQTAQGKISTIAEEVEANRQRVQATLHEMHTLRTRAKRDVVVITKMRAQVEISGAVRPEEQITRLQKGEKPYSVLDLAQLYDFPDNSDGTGQCIGLIELGGGYLESDLDAYFAELKLPRPTVTAVSVDGAKNSPAGRAGTPGPDTQVTLDIEAAGGIAPRAHIAVYFAPNTGQGFLDAVQTASHDKENHPSVLCICWGSTESQWQETIRALLNEALQTAAMLGITVLCAAGDGGVTDGVDDGERHVDFPASSPWVLACGGTSLTREGDEIRSEKVWNDSTVATGGGVSDVFDMPEWQSEVDVPMRTDGKRGRGVPDVAAHANPYSGYTIRVHGHRIVVGGTAAATPLWAGLIARINQELGLNIGYIHPVLYQKIGPKGAFRDIREGNNGIKGVKGYDAGPGWDAVTGWGSPHGKKLLEALREEYSHYQQRG